MNRRLLAVPVALAATSLLATGCSAAGSSGDSGSDGVTVLASFYPLQYAAQQVGGDLVTVDNLTPPAAEPHDLELAPAQAREIGEADLVVYLSGMQPAVDEGVETRAPEHVVDAAAFADLTPAEEDGHAEDEHTEDEHADDEHAEDEHDHGATDPHFWLDPSRMAALGQAVADELSVVDPEHADEYAAGALQLGRQMEELDQEFADGLATCEGATLVTSHAAFGYLAERYSLHQEALSSFDPETEPSPARLREVGDIVRETGVTTIYSETLVSPKVAETLADDLGVETATLDPLEGLSEEALAAGNDYVSVMRDNLAALEQGLVCE
ncbi:metal ABC transporter substrate-binding protein [Myceligenerans pegani]|uniref:Zinc ABC transporter substrate-binding protein n=1 Tax=Myceligenerans pegani TaxID=2776917 RepID=A0ABR9N4B4_9MICO|nr:zinc ABC transporter substrate-binding protein [Myceligenerans sp. TRM 65318]MBE1877822.1 zinc ABC transporter substrate-binding protein [Myceligenerans sp. TRM 65318]MBE3020093.1 zinc ABC transporter substrate-binding protein [Myceligenerans sp. TRM 65318]